MYNKKKEPIEVLLFCASANTKALASSEFIIWLTTPGDAAPGNQEPFSKPLNALPDIFVLNLLIFDIW